MGSWIDTRDELKKIGNNVDELRRKRIKDVEKITGRPLIIYVSDFLDSNKAKACGGEISIDGNDKIGFCEVLENISGDSLDILIHSPGGDPGSAETIIELLRSKFSSIRFIVPDQAKSAATMMCCASEQLLIDEKSELGPIDPQMVITRPDGSRTIAPAQAILSQFDKAKDAIAKNPRDLPAWLPILQSYAPSLLSVCENANELSKILVSNWLKKYMFNGRPNGDELANNAAEYLADSNNHLSHGRRIGIEQLNTLGFNILDLRTDRHLQKAIWDLYMAIKWTFMNTSAFKIIENGDGGAYIRIINVQEIELPPGAIFPMPKEMILPQPIEQKQPNEKKKGYQHH